MPFIEWSDKMSVGVAVLDEQHQMMFTLINELYDAMQDGRSKQVLNKILAELVDYAAMHFSLEEKYFSQTDYPDTEAHIQEHEALKEQVLAAQARFNAGESRQLTLDVMAFMKIWVIRHIQVSDKKYAPYLKRDSLG